MNETSLIKNFTHLHVHSHYSLLGATASIDDLVSLAAAQGLRALSLTDTNALYGVVAFNRTCQKANLRPIIGMNVTLGQPSEEVSSFTTPGRVVLLACDEEGYRSLCRLSSRIQGRPDREEISRQGILWEWLREHRQGVLCLTGGRDDWLDRYLRTGNKQAAVRYVSQLGGLFEENCYLSLELHNHDDISIADEIVMLGNRFGLETVAVQPVYYLRPSDAPHLRLLAAIDRNCLIKDAPAAALPGGEEGFSYHWLSPNEMNERFSRYPQALKNIEKVVERCSEQVLPDGRPIWPVLDLPGGVSPDEILEERAHSGLETRYEVHQRSDPLVSERLKNELDAISGHGFGPLFLVVADIVDFARRSLIPVSTRGSVANSLAAYCLGITTVDPMAHDLLFERFLNPARANMPDIDLDFCSRRRDEVLDYVREKYGYEKVALVATISTLQPKSAVRETAKAYGLKEAQIKRLTALLPRRWHPDPRRRDHRTIDDVLTEIDDEASREVIRSAYAILDQPHHISIHPGGLVITPGELTDFVPVQWTPKGFLVTQYDYQDVETIGLPKLDLLGIRALTVIAEANRLVRNRVPEFDISSIPLDDPGTSEIVAKGETIGVFQCESTGAQRTLRQLKAKTIMDLAVANAFFKPGPATGGMAKSFIRRYRGEEKVSFLHPALEPILKSTKGVLLFQEQILRLAREIAGLSWEQADHLRRGMSKFQAKEMESMRAQFVAGCQRPSPEGPAFSRQQAETLWEQVIPFAGYGFNQGHATAYADVSYRSAFLKTHWPAEFLSARLAERGGFHHPVIYIAEARRIGIQVRPPHINHSNAKFTLGWGKENGNNPVLWMGLNQVRELRHTSIKAIIKNRPYSSLRDLLNRAPLQVKEITHLIQCGGLDGLGESREMLLAQARELLRANSIYQLAFDIFSHEPVIPESPVQRLEWESYILGFPVSVHPLEIVEKRPLKTTPLGRLPQLPNQFVTVAGTRLPGWTGGKGIFFGDGDSFVMVRSAGKLTAWQPVQLNGRWRLDEWGGGWFQVESVTELS